MGKHVADIIRSLIVHVVGNYELSLLDGSTSWERDLGNWITHPVADIQCVKIN